MDPTTTLRWLEGTPATAGGGVTWGVPWPRGSVAAGTGFGLRDDTGRGVPVQSWVTGRWPDGSVKWTGHAAAVQHPAESYELTPGAAAPVAGPRVAVTRTADGVVVDTGVLRLTVPPPDRGDPAHPSALVSTLERGGVVVARDGRLVSELAPDANGRERREFAGTVEDVVVEQAGPVRAVVLVTGRHTDGDRTWLPFRVRLSCYAGSDQVRLVHTLVWDGDPDRDFLCGLGLRFSVPLSGPLHDRHVRLAGSQGFLTEAVRGITGLWPDPGEDVRRAQVEGRRTPPTATWEPATPRDGGTPSWDDVLGHVPAWNDWTLSQLSADGCTVRKRTRAGRGWVGVPAGTRSRGYLHLGTPAGGLELGLRNFWQSHPTQLDVRDAASDLGSVTVWTWSPESRPMDLRFYHDGPDEQTEEGRLAALEVTYEDHRPGAGNASGIARTHEFSLRATDGTPGHDELDRNSWACSSPPVLGCAPDRLHAAGVFGVWALPDRSDPVAAAVEDRLDLLVEHYARQVEDRRWYGFWDHGDVMHTYDVDRHTWRYDVGGYAWDNSELSTDLWLWLSFLRTGDPQTYRLAEAMTRHTGEVDVYHAGPFAGRGTRHNVQHWGCSCKQLRISSPAYRRIPYFLTADERLGDLLDEQVVTDRTFAALGGTVDLGIDLGALLASWFTQWERTGDPEPRQRIVEALTDVAAMPNGFFTGVAHRDPATGRFVPAGDGFSTSHLSAVFGLVEVLDEVFEALDVPEFEQTWFRYCRLYLADAHEQRAELGHELPTGLQLPHTRLLARVAHRTGDAALAARAWDVFLHGPGDRYNLNRISRGDVRVVTGPAVAEPVTEIARVGTNDAAQYGLAAIQNLALIRSALPDGREDVRHGQAPLPGP